VSAAVVTPPRSAWPGLLDHAALVVKGEAVFDSDSLAAELWAIAEALRAEVRS